MSKFLENDLKCFKLFGHKCLNYIISFNTGTRYTRTETTTSGKHVETVLTCTHNLLFGQVFVMIQRKTGNKNIACMMFGTSIR